MTDIPASHDELVAHLSNELPAWLPTQRWFAGKDRDITAVRALTWTTVLDGDPLLIHLVVEVEQGDRTEPYQLLIGSRQSQLPDVASSASIGLDSGLTCYEASGDADLTAPLLDLIAAGERVGGLSFATEPGAELTTGLRAHPITSEQSNTSLVYGRQYILKLFRKLTPGLNKDLMLHRALREVGCHHIADPLGSITAELDGEPWTIGMLQRFMPDAADGWVMATTSVRDFMAEPSLPPGELGGDFAGEAERLGRAVATVHADLARALGVEQADAAELDASVASMLERLDRAAAAVPELVEHVPALREALGKVAETPLPLPVQYVHGDLHLGQVLRTLNGWLLLDFEGEPASSLAERAALRSPLRDVAGMLRSFDYAAQQLLVGRPPDPESTAWAMSWAHRNREAFCDGYAAVAEQDPRDRADLLRALELDKAVYEVAYEHANRPDWLSVPLASIVRIMTEGE
ncbi:aminoglycoside phosphotransferase [Aeromicrobium sp.]|uniref:maltokinase N-terminal cap-like domain-containing protein n=1 Tax=Aeromicrobium sp. TaxID=1871063 RepID=UPI00199FDD9D|nr:aminoglycoside phosphotransferase [Aeromicrobium sp.]MBC7633718.1 aminoglycoside phosphotransferase [Aeromicrobium sp.]